MGRPLRWMMAVALMVVACAPGSGGTTTTKKPPPSTTTTLDGTTTSASSPTSGGATTTTLGNNLSADDSAQVDEARKLMGQPELSDGGQLAENGAYEESEQGVNRFEGLLVYFFEDENGDLTFYLEGPPDLLRGVTVEFDAVDDNGAIVAEGGYEGDQLAGPPPPWSVEPQTENGQILKAADSPPPEDVGDKLGAFIPTPITTLAQFKEISIWIYSGLIDGRFDYTHYRLFYEELLKKSNDGVIVGALLTGLLGEEGPGPAIVWAVLSGS